MKPQSRDSKLKLLQYLVHMNESLVKLVYKPTSGRKPSRIYSPSSTATIPTTWRAFAIFCFLSPPHPLLYLNDKSLQFNLFRILSSQIRTWRPAHCWCAEDQYQALVLQRVAVFLTPSPLEVQILKGQLSCSCQHNKEDVSRDTVLHCSSTKLYLQQLLQQC